jgi:hypothetical protein
MTLLHLREFIEHYQVLAEYVYTGQAVLVMILMRVKFSLAMRRLLPKMIKETI